MSRALCARIVVAYISHIVAYISRIVAYISHVALCMYNKALREGDLEAIERWKDFSVLFDSGLKKLPAVKCIVYRWVFHSVTALK